MKAQGGGGGGSFVSFIYYGDGRWGGEIEGGGEGWAWEGEVGGGQEEQMSFTFIEKKRKENGINDGGTPPSSSFLLYPLISDIGSISE